MQSSRLTTKLQIPPPVLPLVSRHHLIQRLEEGLQSGHLTLVSAAAGYGKTTLLADSLGRVSLPRAWLSLDESDNVPARFYVYLFAAIQKADERIGGEAQRLLGGPQLPPSELVVAAVIAGTESMAGAFVLVLDDYNSITAPELHEAVCLLVEQNPSQLHLVIAARADPPPPLARWRARGQRNEVRAADLCFNPEETGKFLRSAVDLRIAEGEVASLTARTEGWIASLQLAALSLRNETNASSSVASFPRASVRSRLSCR